MNTKRTQLRLSLVAPSGSGKSTLAGMLKTTFEQMGLTVQVLKLAQPLYELQADFYGKSMVNVARDKQNQRLLEVIATEMRRIDANSLVNNFGQRLLDCTADVVINDDLRDDTVDWPYLKREGFRVVRVLASAEKRSQYLDGRGDLSVVSNSDLNLQIARIRADFVLVNNALLADFDAQAKSLAEHLVESQPLVAHRVLHAA
jgi:dephospho-CoA kinase